MRCVPFITNPSRLASYYRAADVFTRPAEAFGKTITEAMACGVPVQPPPSAASGTNHRR